MSDHSLELADDWDLHVGDDGNLPKVFTAQGIAQNVANAFRLFTNDAYFFTDQGIPHFLVELNAHPKINILRSRLKKVALQVNGRGSDRGQKREDSMQSEGRIPPHRP